MHKTRISRSITEGILHWFLLAAILAVFLCRVLMHIEYTPDDTYIYLQYARNAITTHEVAFNAGEPSYGVTSPLWLAVISLTGWCGIDIYDGVKGADILMAMMALVAIYLAQRSLTGDRLLALLTAGVFSTHIWFLRWAGSGMETSLAALLSILSLHALLGRRYGMGAAWCALLTLTRPEASILVLMVFLAALYLQEPIGSKAKALFMFVTWYSLILLPWYAYAFVSFGTVVPNTALAKSGGGFSLENMVSTLVDFGKTLAVSDGIGLFAVLASLVAYVLYRSGRGLRDQAGATSLLRCSSLALPMIWIIVLPGIYVVTSANLVSRYVILISPAITLLTFALPWSILRSWFGCKISRAIVLSGTVILVLCNVLIFETQVRPQLTLFSHGMRECFIYIGTWLNKNVAKDASVLVADVGAIGYYSQRRICDAAGLISPELLPYSRMGYSPERIMAEQVYGDRCRASYVVLRSTIQTAVHAPFLQPILTRTFYGLSLSSQDTTYYTVFKVLNR